MMTVFEPSDGVPFLKSWNSLINEKSDSNENNNQSSTCALNEWIIFTVGCSWGVGVV